jgi:hypothetical protein
VTHEIADRSLETAGAMQRRGGARDDGDGQRRVAGHYAARWQQHAAIDVLHAFDHRRRRELRVRFDPRLRAERVTQARVLEQRLQVA